MGSRDRPNLIKTEWRKSSRSGEAQSSCVEVSVAWLESDRVAG
ncbi:DUF397 domain-containing protein [Actinoallomurus sp. NPDC052308]